MHRKNSNNSNTNDPEDDAQELRIALIRAGSYYKRQTYIENSFIVLRSYLKDRFLLRLVKELEALWEGRRSHGAGRQKFGKFQEGILDQLLNLVPEQFRPKKSEALSIDVKFSTYAKQIIWNAQKSLGKKITKEKGFRNNLVSLSEFDYLASEN